MPNNEDGRMGKEAYNVQEEKVFSVAIVGGGLAGISAARYLSSHFGKKNVVILEAAASLGGRIQNVSGIAPWPVEIGAEFLHGTRSSSAKAIVDEMGCAQRELNFPDYYYIGHEQRLLSNEEADRHPDIRRAHEIFAGLGEEDASMQSDMNMEEYLRGKGANHTVMQLAQSIYGNDFGCSLDKLGVKECIQEARHWIYGDTYLILDRPLSSVVDYMSQGLCVCLNWIVTKVERLPNGIQQLNCQDGRVVKADYIILTVPVAILQRGLINFDPALPDMKVQAVHAIGMLNVIKVVLAFCHKFWPEDLFDVVCSECFLPEVWMTEYPSPPGTRNGPRAEDDKAAALSLGQYVVTGFIAGEAADTLARLTETDIFRNALDQLDAMFGDREQSCSSLAGASSIGQPQRSPSNSFLNLAVNPPEERLPGANQGTRRLDWQKLFIQRELSESRALDCAPRVATAASADDQLRRRSHPASSSFRGGIIVNWSNHSFVRGGYSHPSVNAQGARAALAEPVDGIYFAGEATHPGVNPCLQSAIDTGQRAAQQVIAACRKKSSKLQLSKRAQQF